MSVGTPTLLVAAAPTPGVAPKPRNYLIDLSDGTVYPWPVNHGSEDPLTVLGRRLTRSGVSKRVRLMRQPTHPGPARLTLHGHYLDHGQGEYQAFVNFFNDCDDRLFVYIATDGAAYTVSITQFDARRLMSITHADGSYFEYDLELHVVAVESGPLKGHVA